MAYGLKILNDNLKLQIDSLYQNYALWEHGEGVATVLGSGTYYSKTITFANASVEPPLIAIKPSSARYCGLSNYTRSGSNYTGFVIHSETGQSATIDWMALVPRKDKSSEAYGLRVYNAVPELVFDSGHAPMIIRDVDVVSAPWAYMAYAVVNVAHPSDANAYFIMSPHGWWQYIVNSYPPVSQGGNWWPMFKYIDAATVSFGAVLGAVFSIPAPISFSDGYWPSTWTILTVKKAF